MTIEFKDHTLVPWLDYPGIHYEERPLRAPTGEAIRGLQQFLHRLAHGLDGLVVEGSGSEGLLGPGHALAFHGAEALVVGPAPGPVPPLEDVGLLFGSE